MGKLTTKEFAELKEFIRVIMAANVTTTHTAFLRCKPTYSILDRQVALNELIDAGVVVKVTSKYGREGRVVYVCNQGVELVRVVSCTLFRDVSDNLLNKA